MDKESKNKEYLNGLFSKEDMETNKGHVSQQPLIADNFETPQPNADELGYMYINIGILPSARYYKVGTKIAIRSANVAEIQAYSMVDDNNFIEITDKMNALLSRNVIFYHSDGTKGSYKDLLDGDRIFIIFMIRELTFQGGNTLTKTHECECGHEFTIPFRATPNSSGPTTFDLHEPNDEIEDFYNPESNTYELIDNGVSMRLAPPTIGIQEDFFNELRRVTIAKKTPNIAFMKIMPFMLDGRSSISEEEIKDKCKEFTNMDDAELFQVFNEMVDCMKTGIKGLKMKCPKCSQEVYTELTFPGGASTLFKYKDAFSRFRRKNK